MNKTNEERDPSVVVWGLVRRNFSTKLELSRYESQSFSI